MNDSVSIVFLFENLHLFVLESNVLSYNRYIALFVNLGHICCCFLPAYSILSLRVTVLSLIAT